MRKVLYLAVIIVLTGCKKDIDGRNISELLSRPWKLTALDVITPLQGTPLSGQSSNWYSPGCNSDMLWVYQADGNLIIKDAPSCTIPGTAPIHYSKWTLINNNKEIKISGSPFGNFNYTIISLTETKLIVQGIENVAYSGGEIKLLMQKEYTAN